jgi:hypothetical protein
LQAKFNNIESVRLGDKGKIERVYFYNDRSNPSSNPKYWPDYFEKLKILGKLTKSKTR